MVRNNPVFDHLAVSLTVWLEVVVFCPFVPAHTVLARTFSIAHPKTADAVWLHETPR